jgi:acyl carrier protein
MTTYTRLKNILVSEYKLPPDALLPDARLDALGIDSLGVMELLFKIEEEFRITVPSDQVELATVNDVVAYIERLSEEQGTAVSAQQSTP